MWCPEEAMPDTGDGFLEQHSFLLDIWEGTSFNMPQALGNKNML